MRFNLLFVYRKLILTVLLTVVMMLSFSGNSFCIQQIETQYFTVIYDEDGEYTAGEIAKFCDEIYEKLLARYGAFNDDPRVTCIVNDAVDLANGYAIAFQNVINIYATNMDYELRGQTNWLRNVFAHEMTHMVSLKKASKGPVNFVSLRAGQYDKNPDYEVDVVYHHLSQPAWFYEGTAQLGAETFGSEIWDSHREMLIRAAWLENKLLSMNDMSYLSWKKEIDAELVYNQGFCLIRFIKEKYGYEKIVELNNQCGYFDFEPTIKKVLGISSKELYSDWMKNLDKKYAGLREKKPYTGEKVADKGSADFYPVLSPDGKYLAWLSNRGKDFSINDLLLKDLATGKTEVISKRVDYRISWSHDSQKIVYVKRPDTNPKFYDIFIYDIKQKQEKRISKSLRARDPNFSPGDSLIVFVRNLGGNNSIGIIRSNGSELRFLTSTHDGTQFYTPSFSPDGSNIMFSMYKQDLDRDIAIINSKSETYRHKWDIEDSTKTGFSDSTSFAKDSGFRVLIASRAEERDPSYLPDGSGFIYSSDQTGIFNIYKLDLGTMKSTRMTDVHGGAFSPSAGTDGNIYYSGYQASDFSIFRVDADNEIDSSEIVLEARQYLVQPAKFDLSKSFQPSPYKMKRIVNAIVPTISVGPSFIGSQFGLNVVDVGGQVYLSDLLGYDALTFSGSLGKNLKEDVGLNNDVEFYYERSMIPVTSSKYNHSPRFYMGASRTVINNYIPRADVIADTLYFANRPDLGANNVLHDLHAEMKIADEYRDEFRRYRLGIFMPLASRHYINFEAGYRQYFESLNRTQTIKDFSNYFANGENITSQVSWAGKTENFETRFFTDMDYFDSKDIGLSYIYYKPDFYADDEISPKGLYLYLSIKHMMSTVTDSLVNQPLLYVPAGIYSDGSFAYSTYQPDPLKDELRPYKKNKDLNEFMLLAQADRRTPFYNTVLNGLVFTAYRDIYIKDYYKGEGSGYNWPLKYYLGGGTMLSGYPYFAFWGSKILYTKLGLTVPLRKNISKNVIGVQFRNIYGSAYFEAGKAWNFHAMSWDRLKEGEFKRDIALELRFGMVTFYRFSTIAYARVAWPLDDMSGSAYKNDARRFYFGLRM